LAISLANQELADTHFRPDDSGHYFSGADYFALAAHIAAPDIPAWLRSFAGTMRVRFN
jgi:hypothetical protein